MVVASMVLVVVVTGVAVVNDVAIVIMVSEVTEDTLVAWVSKAV